jgi:hypothetical protein
MLVLLWLLSNLPINTLACSAAALLSIPRPPGVGMLAPRTPDAQLYVVRHKRKRLAITPVEVGGLQKDTEMALPTACSASHCQLLGKDAVDGY